MFLIKNMTKQRNHEGVRKKMKTEKIKVQKKRMKQMDCVTNSRGIFYTIIQHLIHCTCN